MPAVIVVTAHATVEAVAVRQDEVHEHEGDPLGVERRHPRQARPRGDHAVTLRLQVLAVAVISVVGSLRPGPAVVNDQAAMDREAVATLVEQSRDAQGLVPESLDAHLAKLPPGVAQRVRSGALRYHVAPDRRSYDITVAPPAAPR